MVKLANTMTIFTVAITTIVITGMLILIPIQQLLLHTSISKITIMIIFLSGQLVKGKKTTKGIIV